MNLLLLSSSKTDSDDYLIHAESFIKSFLAKSCHCLFIPFAGVTINYDEYTLKVSQVFEQWGFTIESIHISENMPQSIEKAEAIIVGGGNTFHLLSQLQQYNLIDVIRKKIMQGVPYLGWSAGSNIVSPGIYTTNDMPVIQPESFKALNLLPFQINPHYIDGNPPGHQGETREDRLLEFLQINQTQKVIALPEGSALRINDNQITFCKTNNLAGYVFEYGKGKQPIQETDLTCLLNV